MLKDSIEINAPTERIFEWLVHLPDNYRAWHPDHGECRWLKGRAFEEGSILYAEEYLHGELHKFKFKTTAMEPNRRIEYKPSFPQSLLFTKGAFIIEPRGNSCIFTATMSFRFGWLLLKLARARATALSAHMRQEGKNLKKLIEMS
ncbi:MAG: SRPBCC family protein [Candidatus Hodarchaeales archaeon]